MPKLVVLSDRAMVSILSEVKENIKTETGGVFLGCRRGSVWYVVESIDPGPKSIFTATYFEYDREYIIHLMNKVARLYKEPLEVLGLWHRHPGSMDHFSSVDAGTNSEFAAMHPEGTISALVNLDPAFRMTMYAVSLPLQYRQVQVVEGNAHFRDTGILALRDIEPLRKETHGHASVSTFGSHSRHAAPRHGEEQDRMAPSHRGTSGELPQWQAPGGKTSVYNPYADKFAGKPKTNRTEDGIGRRMEDNVSSWNLSDVFSDKRGVPSQGQADGFSDKHGSLSLNDSEGFSDKRVTPPVNFTYGLRDLLRLGGVQLKSMGAARERAYGTPMTEREMDTLLDTLSRDLDFLESLGFPCTLNRTGDGCLALTQKSMDGQRPATLYFYLDGMRMMMEYDAKLYAYQSGLLQNIHASYQGRGDV